MEKIPPDKNEGLKSKDKGEDCNKKRKRGDVADNIIYLLKSWYRLSRSNNTLTCQVVQLPTFLPLCQQGGEIELMGRIVANRYWTAREEGIFRGIEGRAKDALIWQMNYVASIMSETVTQTAGEVRPKLCPIDYAVLEKEHRRRTFLQGPWIEKLLTSIADSYRSKLNGRTELKDVKSTMLEFVLDHTWKKEDNVPSNPQNMSKPLDIADSKQPLDEGLLMCRSIDEVTRETCMVLGQSAMSILKFAEEKKIAILGVEPRVWDDTQDFCGVPDITFRKLISAVASNILPCQSSGVNPEAYGLIWFGNYHHDWDQSTIIVGPLHNLMMQSQEVLAYIAEKRFFDAYMENVVPDPPNEAG